MTVVAVGGGASHRISRTRLNGWEPGFTLACGATHAVTIDRIDEGFYPTNNALVLCPRCWPQGTEGRTVSGLPTQVEDYARYLLRTGRSRTTVAAMTGSNWRQMNRLRAALVAAGELEDL